MHVHPVQPVTNHESNTCKLESVGIFDRGAECFPESRLTHEVPGQRRSGRRCTQETAVQISCRREYLEKRQRRALDFFARTRLFRDRRGVALVFDFSPFWDTSLANLFAWKRGTPKISAVSSAVANLELIVTVCMVKSYLRASVATSVIEIEGPSP